MDANLAVVGISYRTAPVEVRERFSVAESRRSELLDALSRLQGIEEVVLLATCNRTELILWMSDRDAAIDSTRKFLERTFGLQPSEWTCFYRLTGEAALNHVIRVAASLDSMVVGEPEITGQVKSAWAAAQQARTCGHFLDAVFQKALGVGKRVRNETAIGNAAVSVPYAAVELAKRIFGGLAGRKVLVIGAGKMSELSARYLLRSGASAVWVSNRTHAHAVDLAAQLGGEAVPFEDRAKHLAQADIVISSTGCPHTILDREDAERMREQRKGRPVFLIDIAVPRDIHPSVRDVPGVFLYDIDDLENVVQKNLVERRAAAAEAERLVTHESQVFYRKLGAEHVVPTIVALRRQLEEIRRREIEGFRAEHGPLSPAMEEALEALTAQLVQRIASQLARELKQVPGRPEQAQLTLAVRRLFGLAQTPEPAHEQGSCATALIPS